MLSPAPVYMGKTVDEAQIPYRGFPFAADFPVYTDAM